MPEGGHVVVAGVGRLPPVLRDQHEHLHGLVLEITVNLKPETVRSDLLLDGAGLLVLQDLVVERLAVLLRPARRFP